MLGTGRPYPGFWKAPAFVETLADVARGEAPGSLERRMVALALPAAHEALVPQLGRRPRPQRAAHRALRDAAEVEAPPVPLLRKRL
eukprot:7901063-Pyramimonas_sp.AAC.1